MKFIIKIKRDTIKPNPNAGQDTYCIPGCSCTEVERFIRRGNDVVFQCLTDGMVVREALHVDKDSYVPELPHKEYVGLMKGEIPEFVVRRSETRGQQFVRGMTPEGLWLFDYEDTEVECHTCHARFSYEDLKADAIGDGNGDEIWSNSICPKCGEWDCCEIEYESIEETMRV